MTDKKPTKKRRLRGIEAMIRGICNFYRVSKKDREEIIKLMKEYKSL